MPRAKNKSNAEEKAANLRKAEKISYQVVQRPVTVGSKFYKKGDVFSIKGQASDYSEACAHLCKYGLLRDVTDRPPEPVPEEAPSAPVLTLANDSAGLGELL